MTRAERTAVDQPRAGELLTLVRGATFCVSTPSGQIHPDTWQGLYHRDARVVSRLRLTVDGRVPPLTAARRDGASTAQLVHSLASGRHGRPTTLLIRRREVGAAMRETLEVRSYAAAFSGELRVDLGADFALLQPVGSRLAGGAPTPLEPVGGELRAARGRLGLTVRADGDARLERDAVGWAVDAQPGRPWTVTLALVPSYDGAPPADRPVARPAALTLRSTATRWERSVASALADLDALRVELPDLDLAYVGAGVPWFMALFGRDALLTAWEALPAGWRVGLDVLRALARYQGTGRDPRTGEQPGRIPHELRTGAAGVFGLEPGVPYFGTVDATPLSVMLLGELHRWGAPDDEVAALLPAARAALAWCERDGDRDGDGYVEYAADATGLDNQGWKDSAGCMVHADGSQAAAPIALAEVQAYLWGAYTALAALEQRLGDAAAAPRLRRRAAGLRAAFQRDFWLPERGLLAMGLDADKRPLAVAASNMGHCLWAGLLERPVAAAVARRLAQPDLSAGWGLRTLGAGEAAYNPLGYHLGTIWPHDTALAAAGLMRYGHVAAALRLVDGLLDAAESFDWRLPELFGGLDPGDVACPVPYPVACSPQAWSAAAPLLLLRTVLRLDPDVPAGVVHVAPVLPDGVELLVTGLRVAGGGLDLRVRGSAVEVLSAPDGVAVVVGPRPVA